MLDFIIKYWVEALFGVIAAGLAYLCKRIWKLYQDEKKSQHSKEQESLYKELKQLIIESGEEGKRHEAQFYGDIQQEISVLRDELSIVKHGILNMQEKIFKNQCRAYLEEGYKISLAEFEALDADHDTYNSLGGNHDGDALFEMVKQKVAKDLSE